MRTMLAETIAAISVVPMLVYIKTHHNFAGFLGWCLFSIACLVKIPAYLESADYYNTSVFFLAYVFFLYMSVKVLLSNSQTFVEVTTFSALAFMVYFPFAFIEPVGDVLIRITATLTAGLANALSFPVVIDGDLLLLNGKSVRIILACTAIESMALFTGATLGIRADADKKAEAFLISVPVIVFVTVAFAYDWFGENSFYIAHHILSKIGATIALILIAYAVFRLLPELAELIYSLKDELVGGER
jgi:archaeosortase A (PGF-CTERM-specific)